MKCAAMFAFFLFATVGYAVAPAIGTMTGSGSVADGAPIHTAVSPDDLNLENGVSLRLAPRSDVAVYLDHLVLDQGAVRAQHFERYRIDAGDLQIQAAEPGSDAVVRITDKTVEVASVRGIVNVSDGGAMLTRVTSGTHLSFKQAAGQSMAASRTLPSDRHVMLWTIAIVAGTALALGLTAAAQGKSPF